MIKKLLIMLLIFAALPGCKKDSTEDNPIIPDVSYRVVIGDIQETLVGIEGSPQSVTFQLNVTTDEGLLASGKTIVLTVSQGPGTFEASQVTTNSFGQASGKYLVEMPTGQTLVTIVGQVETYSTTASFRLIGLSRPASLQLEPEDQQFVVGREDNFELPIKATVRDRAGRPVQGINLHFGLMIDSSIVGSRVFGTMTQANSSNANGESISIFKADGGYGKQKIFCEVNAPDGFLSEIRNETGIAVLPLDDQIGFFVINTDRDLLNVSPAQPETARVDITVRDLQNQALGGIRPDISVNIGALRGTSLTNENGRAEMLYVVDHLDIPDTATVAIIRGSVPGTSWVSQTSITLIPVAAGNPEFAFMTDTNVITADGGVTFANLTAVVRAESHDPLPNQLVEFSTTHGVAQSPVRTDENGLARTIFTDVGSPSVDEDGNPDSSVVTARVRLLNLESSVRIMIRPFDNVESISLLPESNTISIGENSTMQIRARILKPNNVPVQDGFPVNFTSISGRISPQTVLTETGDAIAEYSPPLFIGVDTLQAWIVADGEIMTAVAAVQITPGIPGRMTLIADPEAIVTGDPDALSNIITNVFDNYGNPVSAGITVSYTTTRGTVRPTAVTDDAGMAISRLTPGVQSGVAVVTASVPAGEDVYRAQVAVEFVPGPINSLELTVNPGTISVPEGGDGELTTLRATLRDGNGNLFPAQSLVFFQVLGDAMPPQGCVFSNNSQRTTALSNNGVAAVTLESGQLAGGKRLRAYSFRDQAQQDTISDYGQIVVRSGFPFDIDMSYSSDGWDLGDNNWGINVAALVADRWGNLAPDNIQLLFEVEPEIVEISQGSTGNRNHDGEFFPGMAFATLTYSSSRTFDTVEIMTTVETQDGRISGNMDLLMPLQNGSMTADANVANWRFEEGQENASIELWATLYDGHDVPIDHGQVVFSTDVGHLRWFNVETEEYEELNRSHAVRLTGLNDPENEEEPGRATIFFQAVAEEIFQDPEDVQQRIFIDVRLDNYDDIQVGPLEILFTRVIE